MSKNLPRDSAGRTLIGFSVLFALAVAAAARDWWERTDLEWARFPTAVEDTGFAAAAVAEGRLEVPALGVVLRRDGGGDARLRDFRMRKLTDPRTGHYVRDARDEVFVYAKEDDEAVPGASLPRQLYLKVGHDHFVKFTPAAAAEAAP